MQWTDAQRAAIEARADEILVSAAAGSGKTAVLVRRVTRLIEEGGDITRLMIVTFTRAAAAEMRDRIAAALEENPDPNVARQAQRVGRAQISTIHRFCLRVIREHFQALDVDPLAHIGEPALLDALKARAVNDTLEKHYTSPDADDQALFDAYDDETIIAMLDKLYKFLMALAEPWAWIRQFDAPYTGALRDHPCAKALAREAGFALEGARALCEEAGRLLNLPGAPMRYQKTYESDLVLLNALCEQAANGTLRAGAIAFDRLASGKREEGEDERIAAKFQALRKKMREDAQAARDLLPGDDAQALSDMNAALPCIRALCALAKETHDLYFSFKQKKDWLDYNDLEHLCYQALKMPDVRRQVASQFDAVFVDEYQDVSEIQEAIFDAVHQGNTLFFVGDVKQSVYRFRLADPSLFLGKYAAFSFSEDAQRRKILLKQNFRSDKNVLNAVNHVFAHAMRARVTEIEYDEDAALYPAQGAREGEAVEVHILSRGEADAPEALTKGYLYEAQLIANRIHAMLKTFRVHAKEGERPMKYRDAVILLRNASAHAAIIARVLQENDIPVYSDADARYFELSEVADMLNLLRAIDNPFQDLPLLSALRCPCFGFTEEELARIRLSRTTRDTPFYRALYEEAKAETPLGARIRDALQTLDLWRLRSGALPVETLIRRLLDVTGIHMTAGAYEDGLARQANLRLLAERAAVNADCTLHEFLETVENMRLSDEGKSAKTLSDQENVVQIMTMHKSKGLEFPVVFLMELAAPFRAQKSDPLLLDARLGAATQFIDAEARITRPTLASDAISAQERRKQRAEEARLLYVAMTRAKEKLILLASPRSPEQAALSWSLRGEAAAGSAAAVFDWIGQSLREALAARQDGAYTAPNGARFDIFFDDADRLGDALPRQALTVPEPDTGDVDPFYFDMLSRKLPEGRPIKTSVSALAKRPITEEEQEETPEDKRVPRETIEDRPRFMQARGMTAVERGSALHRALGCISYDAARGGDIAQALNQLRARALLTEAEYGAVHARDISRFFQSDPGMRALRSPRVQREWAFNLRTEGALVQGVLDLCFLEDGGWVLVDYKSDAYQAPEELREKYAEQMRWYARALNRLTALPVKEMLLYGIRGGDVVHIPF